jgi:hypothetical protein
MRGAQLSLLCALLAVSTLMVQSRAASSRNDWVSDLRWGGYVIVFAPNGQGGFKLIVRVHADEWARLSSVAD